VRRQSVLRTGISKAHDEFHSRSPPEYEGVRSEE
jgi:hypothetical protein